jgi:hypothetical protein
LGFAIQIIGVSLTDQNYQARIRPVPIALQFVGYTGLVISSISPFLALAALTKISFFSKGPASPLKKGLVYTIMFLVVSLSFMEFLWSCSGHPTWYMGFAV